MSLKKFSELRDALPEEVKANAKSKAEAMRFALRLEDVRKARHLTQKTLAASLGMAQPSLSKMEKQDDLHIRSLKKIVKAMGGKLEVSVTFPEGVSYKLYESPDNEEPFLQPSTAQ
ncbi:MAG: XRE family transcriptional regulator [Cloacibacillus sp.]